MLTTWLAWVVMRRRDGYDRAVDRKPTLDPNDCRRTWQAIVVFDSDANTALMQGCTCAEDVAEVQGGQVGGCSPRRSAPAYQARRPAVVDSVQPHGMWLCCGLFRHGGAAKHGVVGALASAMLIAATSTTSTRTAKPQCYEYASTSTSCFSTSFRSWPTCRCVRQSDVAGCLCSWWRMLTCWLRQRYMDELTVMEAPAPTAQSRGFVLEVEPEIRTALLRDANWDEIAAYQLAKIPKAQNDREITKCVASTRNKHTHKCPVGGSHFFVCFVVQTGRRVRE